MRYTIDEKTSKNSQWRSKAVKRVTRSVMTTIPSCTYMSFHETNLFSCKETQWMLTWWTCLFSRPPPRQRMWSLQHLSSQRQDQSDGNKSFKHAHTSDPQRTCTITFTAKINGASSSNGTPVNLWSTLHQEAHTLSNSVRSSASTISLNITTHAQSQTNKHTQLTYRLYIAAHAHPASYWPSINTV